MSAARAGALGLLVALLLGCQSLLGAQTPEQQFYAAQGTYVIAVQEAVTYAQRPDASPAVLAVLQAADEEAYEALVLGRVVLAQPTSATRDQRLALYATAAQAAIARLVAALEEETLN